MLRASKKKQGRRVSRASELLRRYTALPKIRKLSEIGLRQIELTTLAQRAVNCVVGEDVNLENPWVYIKKEKIEDNLDLHSESSEFLNIADKVRSYPDSKLLLCLKKERNKPNSKDIFYICLTTEVKNRVMNLLERHYFKINNAVEQALEREIGIWDTCGSEREIWEETLEKIRPLLAVEIECDFPIFEERRTFSLSLAYPNNWRFVECITKKRNAELVFKRRITSSVQVAPLLIDGYNQTMQICQLNVLTQTTQEYNIPVYKSSQLLNFLNKTIKLLSDNIILNANINLFTNDYKLLSTKHTKNIFYNQAPIKYFRDIHYSRNKYVSALVWHPRISGLVAVAYAHITNNLVRNVGPKFKRLEFMENVVLIWCYSFCVHPKLILHSDREIMSLCFCPYNVNILIGGCTNGQIVIWDLTNKLEQAENLEVILTPEEERNRLIVESYTSWLLFTDNVVHVKPTATSEILASHRNAVTSISWMSSNFECTKNGNIIKTRESEKPFLGGQFITCSLDGLIYFWDLEKKRQKIIKSKSRKIDMPLIFQVSPFRKLNRTLIPLFKLIIESTFSFLPLTKLLIADQKFMYEAINPETVNNIFERTYFTSINSEYPKKFPSKFTAVTNLGTMFTFTWSGYDFDQGNLINYAYGENVSFLSWVHDTPIHTCIVNPTDNDFLLTIGGKIFAVWNFKYDTKAIIWRKNSVRYNSGLWSVNNIGIIVMFRMDSKIELWDLMVDSKLPSRIINQTGVATLNSFLDCNLYHVTKETYFKTDASGNVMLTSLMSKEHDRISTNKQKNTLFHEFGKHIIKRRRGLQQWLIDWKEKHLQPMELFSEDSELNVETVVAEQKKNDNVANAGGKWPNNEYEKKIFDMIMENNKLDPIEIEKNKRKVIKETEEKNRVQNKLKHVLKCSMRIFESKKKSLLQSNIVEKKKKKDYYCKKDPVTYNEIKKMYMQSYYEIEKDILQQLKELSACEQLILSNLIVKRQSSNKNYAYGNEEILRMTKSYIK